MEKFSMPTAKETFCKLLKEAVDDEARANGADYPELADALYASAGTIDPQVADDHGLILAIRNQEGHHHELLSTMYVRRCST